MAAISPSQLLLSGMLVTIVTTGLASLILFLLTPAASVSVIQTHIHPIITFVGSVIPYVVWGRNFTRSGYVDLTHAALKAFGGGTLYWSTVPAHDEYGTYSLNFGDAKLYPSSSHLRRFGFVVQCLVN